MAKPKESAQKLHMGTVLQTLERRLADPDAASGRAMGDTATDPAENGNETNNRNAPCQRREAQSIK